MQTHIATTPFGRRAMSLGQISTQATARTLSPDAVENKWKLFQCIREARAALGATDRGLAILNALLSFHPDTTLAGDGPLIVWPSNEQLSARANGISPATLRRHLANLVDSGLIIRRDSPNGKRYARKGRGGQVEQAFGFDLTPLLVRADEIRTLAEAVQADKRAFRVARERMTLLRRDIVKMIDTAIEEKVPGAWGRILQHYQSIVAPLPRTMSIELIEATCGELQDLWADIRDALESFADSENMSANESHSASHKQNSKTDYQSESKHSSRNNTEASSNAEEAGNVERLPDRELPLGIVLDACPAVAELGGGRALRHWRDFVAMAEEVRPMLGISPSAWAEAVDILGARQAAITLAGIYQRSDQINNAGGYLRNLTDRARDGKFSTWPMIMALLRAKSGEVRTSAVLDQEPVDAMSDALKRSLEKRKWT
ncbi:plasmid replication protein RepC [Mesorhizobium sp. CAU 1741]|uniref:plasmid replication protein RepC n=1 Tax=Mesorhizobium sp. CAU 1741 TaxID=3140366 RepID=UPI00325B465E